MAKVTNLIKKIIASRARKIAERGVKKFGGKVSEYLTYALKISWEIFHKYGKEVSNESREKVITKTVLLIKVVLLNLVLVISLVKFEIDLKGSKTYETT